MRGIPTGTGNSPLGAIDPFGLAAARCELARRTGDAGCSHPCTNVYIDGSGEPLPCDLAATEVSSGSILNAVACATGDCEGVYFNPDGSVPGYTVTWTWADRGGPAGWGAFSNGGYGLISNPDWGWRASISPSGFATGCGLDPFCEAFVGWGNLFLNGDPAGVAQMAAGYTGIAASAVSFTFAPEGLQLAREALFENLYNPAVTTCAADFLSGLVPGSPPNPTACGVAGAVIGNAAALDALYNWIAQHWADGGN